MSKRVVFLTTMVALALFFCFGFAPTPVDMTFVGKAAASTETWEEVVEIARPAVVYILVRNWAGIRTGTGMIFDEEGYVLTCNHIVEEVYTVAVVLPDGREFEGIVVGRDRSHDLAVLKISAENLPVLHLGDSDQVNLGQEVLALGYPDLGYPLGTYQTVTRGIVSSFMKIDGIEYIQTDAAINPGNSGSPLINIRNEVVAMIQRGNEEAEGINYCIAVNEAKPLISNVKAGEIAVFPTLSQAYMYMYMYIWGVREIMPTHLFSSDTQEIFCCAEILDAPSGTEVTAKWLAVDVIGMEEDTMIAEESKSCEGNRTLCFSFSPEDVPPGKYQARLYLNGEVQTILYFEVVESSQWGGYPRCMS